MDGQDLGRALVPLAQEGARQPDALEEVEKVLDTAAAWMLDRISWSEAAKVGSLRYRGHPSSAYTRFVALSCTPKSDPRYLPLERLCTFIGRRTGATYTTQGTFTNREIGESDRRIEDLKHQGQLWDGVDPGGKR